MVIKDGTQDNGDDDDEEKCSSRCLLWAEFPTDEKCCESPLILSGDVIYVEKR